MIILSENEPFSMNSSIRVGTDQEPRKTSVPTLIYNNWDDGTAVISRIEDELHKCKSFDFSVAFITKGGLHFILQHLVNNSNTISGRI